MTDPIELDARFEPVDVAAWRERVARDLRGKDPEALRTTLLDGVEVDPLYVPADARVGRPGAPPFTRGATARREWAIVHVLDGDDVSAMRDGAARAAGEGADAIWVAPEAAAALGDPEAMSALLGGFEAPVTIDAGADPAAVSAALVTLESGADVEVVSDPIAAFARGELDAAALDEALGAQVEHVRATRERSPLHRPVLIDVRPHHEAGASAVDEIGVALAGGVDALRTLSDAGLSLADLPLRMRFAFALDADLFVGIAKLRAARLAWSKVLRALGVDGPEQGMRVFADSSRRATSALDPHVNILRGTAAAFAAVVGGADRVAVSPYDAVLAAPTAHGERLARNTQLLLRWEAHLGDVADPAGGSAYVEALTDRLARGGWEVFQEIEHLGGVARGLKDGSLPDRIAETADARRHAVATRRRVLVGANRYPTTGDGVYLLSRNLPDRGHGEGTDVPDEGQNSFTTKHRPLSPMREAGAFEGLRREAAGLSDAARRAVVLPVGDAAALSARVGFAREALEVAGLSVVTLDPQPSEAAALEALDGVDPAPRTVALCAADGAYEALARTAVEKLRERGAGVVVAGRPTDPLREAGVDAFVHLGMDAVEVLGGLVESLTDDREEGAS